MPDRNKKFHDFALKSILFKGRNDWYFCYLKTERIAHVLALLTGRTPSPHIKDIALQAQTLPGDIAHLAAGELQPASVLAQVFALLSALRLAATQGFVHTDTATTLQREYEQVAERLSAGSHLSPFVGPEDFLTPEFIEPPLDLPAQAGLPKPKPSSFFPAEKHIKDIKGHADVNKGQNERVSLILAYIRKHLSSSGHGASIKDIAAVVQGCSEKTIQRELNSLIEQGLVRRVGERRWSVYEAI